MDNNTIPAGTRVTWHKTGWRWPFCGKIKSTEIYEGETVYTCVMDKHGILHHGIKRSQITVEENGDRS